MQGNLGKKRGELKKSKKKGLEEEDNLDFEHLGKGGAFQPVTFDFLEPDHKYHKNLYNLLRKTFAFVNWDLFPLVETICEKNEFGIFLGVGDEEPTQEEADNDIYAALSIVSFARLPAQQFSDRLAAFCLEHCSEQNRPLLAAAFARPASLGLLVNDRVINLPFMLVPTLFDQLLEDKKFLETDEEYTDEERALYVPEMLLYFVPTGQPASKKGKEATPAASPLFYKQEDKVISQKALFVEAVPQKVNEELQLYMLLLRYEDFLALAYSKTLFK